jgi:hypothetical protein
LQLLPLAQMKPPGHGPEQVALAVPQPVPFTVHAPP